MGLKPSQKAGRDRARAHKALRQNPAVLGEMLARTFNAEGRRHGPSLKQVAQEMDRRKSWLGTSLLKQLVGRGYVRPDGDGYSLTRSGAALLCRNSGDLRDTGPGPILDTEDVDHA